VQNDTKTRPPLLSAEADCSASFRDDPLDQPRAPLPPSASATHPFSFRQIRRQGFNRHDPVGVGVVGSPHLAHAPAAQHRDLTGNARTVSRPDQPPGSHGPTNDKSGDSFAATKRNNRAPLKSKQTRCDTRPSQSRIDSEERRVGSGQRYGDWIERVYNRRHRHCTLGMIGPVQFENQLTQTASMRPTK
jgi:hypothetical protein